MRQLIPSYNEDPHLPEVFAFPSDDWVRAVFVSSADGAAALDGRAGGLGSEADKSIFALQRSLGDVVLVGAGTARVEGYKPITTRKQWLHVRGHRPPSPPIAVVSRDLRLDPRAPLFTEAPEYARTIVITCAAAPAERRDALGEVADVIVAGDDSADLSTALDELADRGLRRVTCDGGPILMAHLIAAGRLDELCLTLSPLLVSGDAPRITDGPPIAHATQMTLSTLLEEDGFLFLLYRLMRHRRGSA